MEMAVITEINKPEQLEEYAKVGLEHLKSLQEIWLPNVGGNAMELCKVISQAQLPQLTILDLGTLAVT